MSKLAFTIALILMIGGVVTIDTQQISYTPSMPIRLGLVASGVPLCLLSILLNRHNKDSTKGDDNP